MSLQVSAGAMEAAEREILELRAKVEAMREALQRIADGPNTDSTGTVAIVMRDIARTALGWSHK